MLGLPTINYNGGRRTYRDVLLVTEKITKERHWRNLWLNKTLKIMLRVKSPVIFKDDGDEILLPEQIIIHDLAGDFLETKTGDLLVAKIGYADKNEQRCYGVNAFSVSILKQGEMIQLAQ